MGLSAVGLTVADTGVFIGVLDADDAHHQSARAELAATRARGDRLVLPASAYAELLVRPAAAGPDRLAQVEEFLTRLPAHVEPLTAPIAARAAQLRAQHRGLRLPDALVIATAAALHADLLVTTDHRWPTAAALGLTRITPLRPHPGQPAS